MCRKEGPSIEGKKHECVKHLSDKRDCAKPPPLVEYSANVPCIPDFVTEIAKVSVYRLREILRVHNVLDSGNKDELVARVGMVRRGRSYLAFHRELEAIRNIINATRTLMIAEKSLYLEDPKVILKRRKFAMLSGTSIILMQPRDRASTQPKQNAFLPVTDGLSLDNLKEALTPLSDELSIYQKLQHEKNHLRKNVPVTLEAMRSVGARVLVSWSKDEVGTSGWKSGKGIYNSFENKLQGYMTTMFNNSQ